MENENIVVNLLTKTIKKKAFVLKKDFTILKKDDSIFLYRIIYNQSLGLIIQIHNFNFKMKIKTINKLEKCIYCNKKNVDIQFKCCKKFAHLSCYCKDNFILKRVFTNSKKTQMSLEAFELYRNNHFSAKCCNNLVLDKTQDECPVCFEMCNTTTICKHRLCNKCMFTLKIRQSTKIVHYDVLSVEIS